MASFSFSRLGKPHDLTSASFIRLTGHMAYIR